MAPLTQCADEKPLADRAFLCGYQDEHSGAPSTSAPRIYTTGAALADYERGRHAALLEVMAERGL